MAEDPAGELVVKPQQLIGGINGMILQLHKMQVELEESKHKREDFTKKIGILEAKNESLKNEIDDLTKVKERLTEQSGFLEKTLKRKTTENSDLLERLKQAEIQLGESGSVLNTVRSLESKNELLSEKMSTVVLSTEEEISKAKTQREHYSKLMDEINDLNKRNVAVQKNLKEAEKTNKQHHEQAKALIEKTEGICFEISKNLDDLLRTREKYRRLNEEKESLEKKAKNNLESKALLAHECKDLQKKIKDLETTNGNLEQSVQEQRKDNKILKEQLAKSKREKEELYKEVHSLWKQLDKRGTSRSSTDGIISLQNPQKTKQYEDLEKQIRLMAGSYGETKQQGMLKESVDESKDLLKDNLDGAAKNTTDFSTDLPEMAEGLEGSSNCFVSQEYVAILVEMQGIFQQSDERDEELANLEKIAGIPEQRVEGGETKPSSVAGESSGIASCIRGLVSMKDSQIDILVKERDELREEIVEKKKIEYRQLYVVDELQKQKDDLSKKLIACQEKYHKVKEEKENMRQDLLVRNATENMTQSYINNLKQENEKYKNALERQQESMKEKYITMKSAFDKKLDTKDTLIRAMKDKLVVSQNERDLMKRDLDSLQMKDNVIKEQIISIFEGNPLLRIK